MKQIKTLTVNGNTYEIADPDAAHIDDSAVGTNAWSSKTIIDRLCPAFSQSGGAVTCNPVEGYPLKVTSRIEPAQAGEGIPSPENIRPITGVSAVTLTHNESPITIDLGQAVHGGSLDWSTGVLTVDRAVLAFNGTEKWVYSNPSDGHCRIQHASTRRFTKDTRVCSHYSLYPSYSGSYTFPYMRANDGSGNWTYEGKQGAGYYASADEFKAYLAEQYAAGTPVQVCYQLTPPITVQLTPAEVLALSGENILYSDTGDTAVTGRTDLPALLQSLTAAQ